ncbi:MAG TPA: hypothetical protein VJ692_08460 [Nitrospiraceae bacterium]|nr:hypothetical protein [Nitrospiraceae bacterium]
MRLLFLALTLQVGCALLSPMSGARKGDDYPENAPSNVSKTPLPAQQPSVRRLEFGASPEGLPLRPKGQPGIEPIVTDGPSAEAAVAAREAEARETALKDRRVQEKLGNRFSFLTAEKIPMKQRIASSTETAPYRVMFFSYSRNAAVEVRIFGSNIERVEVKSDYEPPEGEEEIQAAVALARKDPRLEKNVNSLDGRAILTSVESGQPGHGHRVLWVTFAPRDSGNPLYFATVDLIDSKVLNAGPVPSQ